MAVTKQEVILEFKADTSDVTKNIDNVEKSINETSDATAGLSSTLDSMTGGAISGFKNTVGQVRNFVTGLKTLKVALAATGIGVLVLALGTLVTYFTRSEEGARKLARGMEVVKTVTNVIIDRIGMLGKAIVQIFERDFSGAAKTARNAISGVNEEISEEIELFDDLILREQALEDARIRQTVQTAKTRAEIKELNLVAEDLTKTTEEREAAAFRAGELERALFEERKRLAEEELAIAEARLDNTTSLTEDRQKVAELEANIFQLAQESLELQTTLNNKLNTIRAEGLRIQQEEYALQLERLDKTNEALQAEVVLVTEVNNQQERGLMLRQNAETVATGIVISEAEKRKQARRDEFENTIDLLEDEGVVRLQLAQASFAALSALNQAFSGEGEQEARKAFNRNKALSLATAIAQTAQGIITQLASPKDVLTGSNFIKAAIVAATGAAQVANISKTKYESAGQGNLSTSIPRPGETAGAFGGAPQLDLGFLGGGANQEGPIQAYVIAQNVSNAQQANQKIKDQTLIG